MVNGGILLIVIAIVIGVFTVWQIIDTVSNHMWQQQGIRNFPFIHKGKVFWYSRSVSIVLFTFCRDADGDWCVLANKRGRASYGAEGLWNAPCGYLDFDESGEECAQRETFEETGIMVHNKDVKLIGLDTHPEANKQNITIRYYAILDGTVDEYTPTSEYAEPNEVLEIKWIKIPDIKNYQWAFNHNTLIDSISEKLKLKKQ